MALTRYVNVLRRDNDSARQARNSNAPIISIDMYVGIIECTIIYDAIKYNAECCNMVEASRRHGFSEVVDQ